MGCGMWDVGCGMWDVRNLKGGVQDENRKARLGLICSVSKEG